MAFRQRLLRRRSRTAGQAILEFAMLLPLFLTLGYFMIQVHTAIQIGINNQRFARNWLFTLLYNHRDYPKLKSTVNGTTGKQDGEQRWWIGVANDLWFQNGAEREDQSDRLPQNPVVKVVSSRASSAPDEETWPAQTRTRVRIRVASFICLPPKFLPMGRSGRGGVNQSMFLADGSNVDNNLLVGGGVGRFDFCEGDVASGGGQR